MNELFPNHADRASASRAWCCRLRGGPAARAACVAAVLVVIMTGCRPSDTSIGGTVAPTTMAPTTATAPPTTATAPPTTTTAPPTTTTAPTTTAPPTTAPPTTAPPTTAPPTTAPPTTAPPPATVLEPGEENASVRELQERLRDLRFWVGPIDGGYGPLTEQAVYAFQKANGIEVDGRVGSQTRAALADPVIPKPQSTAGRAMEVDKAKQLLYSVLDGELQWVFHTSTGTELPYEHPGGYTALADTPPGTHTVFYEVDGWQDGELGPLYRPKYFHRDGIAVHGYGSVPPYPASHGCVRVSFAAVDYIWEQGLMPLESTVLVYGETPAV